MHATVPHLSSPRTRIGRATVSTAAAIAALVGAVAAAVPATARAAVFADVVSSTPVTAFVPVQRRQCGPVAARSTDPAVVDGDSQPAGAGADAATGCRTVTVRTQRVVGYDVVYAIGGERHTVRLDRDPGPRVELGVVAQAPATGRPVGRLAGPPVERIDRAERPVGQPVPAVVDDGGAVAAPVYGYGEQAPIGAQPSGSTTVIVERGVPAYGGWYDPYPYGYGYGYGYGWGWGPGWAVGPSIGIGYWGGGRWGGGHRRWDGGHRPGPPKDKFPHRVGGGPNARR